MKKALIILAFWIVVMPIVTFHEPSLFRLAYSVAIALIAYIMSVIFNTKIWALVFFLTTLPPLFEHSIEVIFPNLATLARWVGTISVLLGVIFSLYKIYSNGKPI